MEAHSEDSKAESVWDGELASDDARLPYNTDRLIEQSRRKAPNTERETERQRNIELYGLSPDASDAEISHASAEAARQKLAEVGERQKAEEEARTIPASRPSSTEPMLRPRARPEPQSLDSDNREVPGDSA